METSKKIFIESGETIHVRDLVSVFSWGWGHAMVGILVTNSMFITTVARFVLYCCFHGRDRRTTSLRPTACCAAVRTHVFVTNAYSENFQTLQPGSTRAHARKGVRGDHGAVHTCTACCTCFVVDVSARGICKHHGRET